jgi:glycosyltransferase involved in cell wall biosynthesis
MAGEPVDHQWFRDGLPPVVLTVGRLGDQKDHPTLLRAFAKVRACREARLVILGEAPNARETQRRIGELRGLACSLGIEDDVDFLGYQPNPFKYMSRAAVFALTSRFEGLGNALIEALACGCPIVSTDCESGPAEILSYGRYGQLVPVGDIDAVAEAILLTLDSPCNPDYLKSRAEQFSVDRVASQYEQIMLASVE